MREMLAAAKTGHRLRRTRFPQAGTSDRKASWHAAEQLVPGHWDLIQFSSLEK